jgi:hypothetical protein
MTDQHRATPEQWAYMTELEEDPTCDPKASCLLELRARVEQLEAAANDRQQDEDAERAAAPADSLVERVADAIAAEPFLSSPTPVRKARAAIREVAAAVIEWHDSDQLIRTAWEAGKWLEQEANR